MRAEIDEERTAWKLEKAGCRNVKAAKALLGDYGGDVAKLKAECPYLFEEDKPKGSTGRPTTRRRARRGPCPRPDCPRARSLTKE